MPTLAFRRRFVQQLLALWFGRRELHSDDLAVLDEHLNHPAPVWRVALVWRTITANCIKSMERTGTSIWMWARQTANANCRPSWINLMRALWYCSNSRVSPSAEHSVELTSPDFAAGTVLLTWLKSSNLLQTSQSVHFVRRKSSKSVLLVNFSYLLLVFSITISLHFIDLSLLWHSHELTIFIFHCTVLSTWVLVCLRLEI